MRIHEPESTGAAKLTDLEKVMVSGILSDRQVMAEVWKAGRTYLRANIVIRDARVLEHRLNPWAGRRWVEEAG